MFKRNFRVNLTFNPFYLPGYNPYLPGYNPFYLPGIHYLKVQSHNENQHNQPHRLLKQIKIKGTVSEIPMADLQWYP